MDGVAVVRPVATSDDSRNALNTEVQPFKIDNAHVGVALATVLVGRTSSPDSAVDHRQFPIVFKGGTMVEALNALIRAHGAAMWNVGVSHAKDQNPSFLATVWTYDGGAANVGTPLRALLGNSPAR